MAEDRASGMRERVRIKIKGIVQGVGFRPFVRNLAVSLSLYGWVKNTGDGVQIEAEGTAQELEVFISRLKMQAPPLSVIREFTTERLPEDGSPEDKSLEAKSLENNLPESEFFLNRKPGFFILQSSLSDEKAVYISPDLSICEDCITELADPADYRYLYPFINCTNCGPRFTITLDAPYDRVNTTMRDFEMCPVCRKQYEDPADRRYHAQPVSCHYCGPRLAVHDEDGNLIPVSQADIPLRMAGWLQEGQILAVKGLGGYHLVCDAYNSQAVTELRKRKERDEKPFALMARDLETIRRHCVVYSEEEKLLQSVRKPIVLLQRKQDCMLPEALAPSNPSLGMMLPYMPLHLLVFREESCPDTLVMTSGNRSSEPIYYKDEEALRELKGIARFFVTHNREIHIRTDDSVTRVLEGKEYILRRARGYVPAPISLDSAVLPQGIPSVLACGGELKNTFCLNRDREFFLSHHIGDLENLETLASFEEGVLHFQKLFDLHPEVVAFDLHPGYFSTQYAKALEIEKKLAVQHHHAHIASCMAENGLCGEVIGLAFDGTGYGEDGNLWGGEFFAGGYGKYRRMAHIGYVGMPGGSAAIHEPWRMAVSYMAQAGMDVENLSRKTGGLAAISRDRILTVLKILNSGFNTPKTSGMGRLFDAVSAMIGLCTYSSFEGQAAMKLEHAADRREKGSYDYHIEKGPSGDGNQNAHNAHAPVTIHMGPVIRQIFDDLERDVPSGIIAMRFHRTLAGISAEECLRIREETGLNRVVLSGGVFQNMLLFSLCLEKLKGCGFEVFTHSLVPSNDGGISLGQAVIAAHVMAQFPQG